MKTYTKWVGGGSSGVFLSGVYLSGLFALLVASGCKVEGTGTGNPMQNTGSPAMGTTSTATDAIAYSTCYKTALCHKTAELGQCIKSVGDLTSYAGKLGFSTEPPLTMLEIRALELKNLIHPKVGHLKQCLNSIGATSCESPEAKGAYAPDSASPYMGTAELFTMDCADIFTSESRDD